MRKFLFRPRYSLFGMAFVIVWFVGIYAYRVNHFKHLFSIAAESPLPAISVAKQATKSIENAYKKPYTFSNDWFTRDIPVWNKILAPYRGKPNVNYLEIGIFEGRSLLWMLENILTGPDSQATAIDVFFDPAQENRYRSNLNLSGLADKVITIKGFSQIEMRKLPFESFDVIYVDGSHRRDDALEDAVLAWRLVKPGGLIIFDDYGEERFVRNTSLQKEEYCTDSINAFAECFGREFQVVHNGYQLVLRRKTK